MKILAILATSFAAVIFLGACDRMSFEETKQLHPAYHKGHGADHGDAHGAKGEGHGADPHAAPAAGHEEKKAH